MDQREREICRRAKQFREAIKWPQRDFAAQIGISLDQLASIEYERTPLRYIVAWNYRSFFGISLESLVEIGFPVLGKDLNPWPEPETLPNTRILLSEVWNALAESPVNSPILDDVRMAEEFPSDLPPPGYVHRATWFEIIGENLKDALASMAEGSVKKFGNEIIRAIDNQSKLFPKQAIALTGSNREEMELYLLRKDIARRLLIKNAAKTDLTKYPQEGTTEAVTPILPKLIERLRKATSERGQKSKLASWLGVSPQKVTDWLSERIEPSGENTLRLLKWVEQQERQK